MLPHTRPAIDMMKPTDENAKIIAKAAFDHLSRNPGITLADVISSMIFGVLEVDEITDELEAKILLSLGRSFGCQIVNTPDDEINAVIAETEELDTVLDGVEIDDHQPGRLHDLSLDDQEEVEIMETLRTVGW